MTSYVELHCHSAFSFLDGASLPTELLVRAAELGYKAFALTDHNGLCGSMELAQAARDLSVRALHGAEIDLDDGRHITLLVQNASGWSNLCRLLTLAHAHTRDNHERDRRHVLACARARNNQQRDRTQASVTLRQVMEHARGLICLSGCAERGVHERSSLKQLLEAFDHEHLYIELQRPFARFDRVRNRKLVELARQLKLKCVATGNVHAHTQARAYLQDVFVAVRLHMLLDESEPFRRPNHSHVLQAPQVMAARFADYPAAVAQTEHIAEMIEFDLTNDLGYRYPGVENKHADRQLAQLCKYALHERYGAHHSAAESRLEEELNIIAKLSLSGFFLLHHEILELAREVASEVRGHSPVRALLPPGRGRGSSVSSIVCYLTGLSHIDPLQNDLFLGRFLHEELTALPDIDLDFPRDIREVLIPRIHERYGHDRSALVAAFPTYRARGAIRDFGAVLGLPSAQIERVARGSEGFSGANVARDIVSVLGEEQASKRGWRYLAALAAQAHSLPRNLSQHCGGMIVATRPLIDCCPVVPAAMKGRQMVQWDKDSCSDAGFLKIDLLGLGMLSAVEECVELIAQTRNEQIDLSRIPFDDPATYRAIQTADTTGVFQIESRAQMQSLQRTRPANLDDLTIQVALVRPGPILGGAVNPYIERRERLRQDPNFQITYDHPALEPVLKDTLGTIIFQDQVIEVAQAFAGFTPSQAESLRRAMSRNRSQAAIEAHHKNFVDAAIELHGVDEQTAQRIWRMIVGFSGFGFPKAHGAAFGLLAYQSTWLRVHYSAEFLCALLNEQPMGFYPPDSLIHEAQRRNITILRPDVRFSEVNCSVIRESEGNFAAVKDSKDHCSVTKASKDHFAVRIGLGYVVSVKREDVEAIVNSRHRDGPFRTLEDLAARAGTGRAALEQLAWSGACDGLANGSRRTALWQLGVAVPGRRVAGGTQLSLPLELPGAPALKELNRWDAMLANYATTTMSIDHHPLSLLRDQLKGTQTTQELPRLRNRTRVRIGGLVVARQRPATANGVVFVLLEDEYGTANLVVLPPVYERYRQLVRTEPLLLIDGLLERSATGPINIRVSQLRPLAAPHAPEAEVHQLRERSLTDLVPNEAGSHDRAETKHGSDFRAVAPPVQSFAAGRRR